jgi:hypothetical protein
MLRHQRRRQLVEVAVHDRVDLVEGQVDPMVRDTALREIVGPDPLGAVARPDQRLPFPRFLFGARAPFAVEEA